MKKSIFFLTLFFPLAFGFSMSQAKNLSLDLEPPNATVVSKTSNSISFDWDDCACLSPVYRVFYRNGGFVSTEYSTTDSEFTFSDLTPGNYVFYFYTVSGTEVSGFIVIEDTLDV